MEAAMRLVLLADTHTHQTELGALPSGDALILAGDLCNMFSKPGYDEQLSRLNRWLGEQPFTYRLVIGGNHDGLLQSVAGQPFTRLSNATWLCDSGVTIEGIQFWGSPWTSGSSGPMAFQLLPSNLKAKWDLIPHHTDVLITHGPPYGVLDQTSWGHGGDEDLRDAVERTQPALHVFGHIHTARGIRKKGQTLYVNACVSGEDNEVVASAVVVDLMVGGLPSVVSFGD
jgi:predicted phosphodiesterase